MGQRVDMGAQGAGERHRSSLTGRGDVHHVKPERGRRPRMIRAMRFSSKTVGLASAVITVFIWTGFIVIARASASRGLLPLDIALARILGASAVLLPWAWWLMRPARRAGEKVGSLWGLSPLPLRQTVQTGLLGGFLYAILAYTGFFYAPASHLSLIHI